MSDRADRLPSGWKHATLPDLIASGGLLTDGDWVETEDQDINGEVRLTQLADVGDGHFRDRSSRFMNRRTASELRCTYLEPGDVMIARMPDPLGRACLFPGAEHPCVTVVDVCVVRPGTTAIRTSWLMNFVNAPAFRGAVSALQAGSTRKRISKANLSTIRLPVPPTREQDRIVAAIDSYFSRLDDATATLERVQRNLERYRASVLKAAVEGRLVPTEAELARKEGRSYEPASELLKRILVERRRKWEEAELAKMIAKGKPPKDDRWKAKYVEPAAPETEGLPELPEGWCWATVAMLGDAESQVVMTGPFGTSLKTGDFVDEGVRVLTIGCLTTAGVITDKAVYVSPEKAKELDRYRLRTDDVLFSRMATVGRAGRVTEQLEGCLFNYHIMRLRFARDSVNSEYFLSYVRGSQVVSAYLRDANHGATRDGINTEQLLCLPIALPPRIEQARIESEVERVLSVTESERAEMNRTALRLDRLRQSILKWAFEGRLVDQDPADEPASVLLDRIRAERASASDGSKDKPKRGRRVKATDA